MKVIRQVFTKEDGHVFSENVEQRLQELEAGEDFRLWQEKVKHVEARAQAGGGANVDDALEVL